MAEASNVLEGFHQEKSTSSEDGVERLGTIFEPLSSFEKKINVLQTNTKEVMITAPTDSDADEFNMNHKSRGSALIFNHKNFNNRRLPVREGTNVDRDELKKCLEMLHFDVKIYNDYRLSQIKDIITDAAKENHSDNDCILIAILSYSENGGIYSKDTQYQLEAIWNPFTAEKCPSLAGKPKLFFVQACDYLDPGVSMKCTTERDGQSSMNKIPTHADFLLAYSTLPGCYSWNNSEATSTNPKGSCYIQSLCSELESNGKTLDILELLTNVAQRVAMKFEARQIPCITSMLTRTLYFNDKALPAEK